MINNVLKFEECISHNTDKAVCLQCGKSWIAVAPVNTQQLECPACHNFTGIFEQHKSDVDLIYTCTCGSEVWYVAPEGVTCPNCGYFDPYKEE